jgi:hypothetical protein
MKWQAGQRVHYTYNPSIASGNVKKEYHGMITDVKDDRVYIQWGEVKGIESYGLSSFIVEAMVIVSELAEDNPNRKFTEENTYGDKV